MRTDYTELKKAVVETNEERRTTRAHERDGEDVPRASRRARPRVKILRRGRSAK